MLKKLSLLLSAFKNFDKIKAVLSTVYSSLQKTIDALVYLETQTNGTKLGNTLHEHLPKIIDVLNKLRLIYEKFAPYLGIKLEATVQPLSVTSEVISKQLDSAAKNLDSVL